MMKKMRIAISTCPNDTFAFHGLLSGASSSYGLEVDIELLDIQQLNSKLMQGNYDIAKVSFHAALTRSDQLWVLPVGSALGFGVGPLLLAGKPQDVPTDVTQLTLCPGPETTATMLFKLFYPQTTRVEHVVFSEIMPRLKSGQCDFGVCIHEGRFTYQAEGLYSVCDLGTMWEFDTRLPLPLGGLVVNRQLPSDVICHAIQAVRASLEYAVENPELALPSMRKYAQEFDDDVLMQHVSLYVNAYTRQLGPEGAASLRVLSEKAKNVGLIPATAADLVVFDESENNL
ncbi:MAG: 1,4-dihydroxy-6-naphthoate synthase [Planctomycetales bacterium]|nr:1,4-dihydroxy-6-naphthoate synthase [Planctomycetales bacterium]